MKTLFNSILSRVLFVVFSAVTVPASHATVAAYGPSRTADFSHIYAYDGSGYVSYGILASNQALYYRSGDQVSLASGQATYFANGYVLSGTVNGTDTLNFGVGTVTVRDEVLFHETSHYLISGTLYGNQAVEYYSGSLTVDLKDDTDVVFAGGLLVEGTLYGSQNVVYLDDPYNVADGIVQLKASTTVYFDNTGDNLCIQGTLNGVNNLLWYSVDGGWGGENAVFADNTVITFGIPVGWGSGSAVSSGTLSSAQNICYFFQGSPFVYRTAYLKDFVVFYDTTGVSAGTSASSQTLVSSGGSYNAANNEALTFSGGYVVP